MQLNKWKSFFCLDQSPVGPNPKKDEPDDSQETEADSQESRTSEEFNEQLAVQSIINEGM